MSVIRLNHFRGLLPAAGSDIKPAGFADVAADVRLTSGDLRPLSALSATVLALTAGSAIKSVYRFGQDLTSTTQYWFQSTGDVDYVKGAIDNDTTERTFFTDGTFPKKTDSSLATGGAPYPTASYAMGIPAPATAPSVSVTGTATTPTDPAEAVVYVMTYVSAWGEEGPPSPPSTVVSWRAGQTLALSSLPVAPSTGAHGENYNITGKRLYRSATGSQSTQYQLVNSTNIAIATTTYNDTKTTATLLEVLETLGWNEPAYNMIGLRGGPNGVMAGFFGNTVCFCQPYVPSAWPVRFQQSTDAPIVGIEWFDQTLFVGTTQGVYLFTGADPSNMSGQKLATAFAPVSKRSIVPMLGGVYYASSVGLIRLDANGAVNVTAAILRRTDWQAYAPSTWSAYESDGRYIAFYNNGATAGLIFDLAGETASFSTTSLYATAGYRDKKADQLFLVDSNNLKTFDTGAALTYTWRSAVCHLEADDNMGAAMVDATAYPVTFQLYADDTLVHTQTVTNRYAFRCPAGFRSSRWAVAVSGTSTVREVAVASTMGELAKV